MIGALALLVAAWPASFTADDVRAVEGGRIVEKQSVVDGVIHADIAARVDAAPSWVVLQLVPRCRAPETKLTTLRFVAAPSASTDVTHEVAAALPAMACAAATGRDVFYTYGEMDPGSMLPTLWSLIKTSRGFQRLTATQVAGSFGTFASETRVEAAPAGAYFVSTSTVTLGHVPDRVARTLVDKLGGMATAKALLEDLRRRARSAR